MNDILVAIISLIIITAAFAFCIALHARGVKTSYIRDLLHIGTVMWVFGWPYWEGIYGPISIVSIILTVVILTPVLSNRIRFLQGLKCSVSDDNETWSGVVLYVASYTVFTCIGFTYNFFSAAAALTTLSIADGLGGFVGRRYGKSVFKFPWGKEKSYIGSLTVALSTFAAIGLTAMWFATPVNLSLYILISAIIALVEAVSPKTSDNVLIPIAVFVILL